MTLPRLILGALLMNLSVPSAHAFTFLGPFKSWMTRDIGYNNLTDIGGPLLPSEGFRWNTPTVYYAFDRSFIEFFGSNGVAAVDAAMKVFNDLPEAGSFSPGLTEYPLNTRQINYRASSIGLLDLKSHVMGMVIQQMGIGSPEVSVWSIRSRTVINQSTNYAVVKFNYDPVSFRPSSYVNGALYTYEIFDGLLNNTPTTVAAEIKVADLRTRGFNSVASIFGAYVEEAVTAEQDPATGDLLSASGSLFPGQYLLGLTRDDVGAIRRLYTRNNLAVEDLPPGVTISSVSSSGGPWNIPINVIVTNITLLTNSPIALRPGVEKLTFQRVQYDSLIGTVFNPFTVNYTDQFIEGGELRTRRAVRRVQRPDIVFGVGDLGITTAGTPVFALRTGTDRWIGNSAINRDPVFDFPGTIQEVGPGVIQSPITLLFSDLLPFYRNFAPSVVTEAASFVGSAWGSFTGASGEPVVYPVSSGTGLALLQQIASGIDQGVTSPWEIPFVLLLNTNTTGQVTAGATP